jgi:superfamily I DNA and RNA helicase
MIEHLYDYAEQSEIKFDTIVLDERQDFNDEWMDIIEKLLVDENSKILCVADPNQDLYERGFFMPEGGSPWALAELRLNCRNTREIASFVSQFGGGPSASASPEGDPVKFIPVSDTSSMMEAVLAEIRHSLNPEGLNEKDIVIITGTSVERDLFYNLASDEFSFGRWEDRTEEIIACETAKRAKGIEANFVILTTLNEEIRENEIYVGASRARTNLVIVGPESFAGSYKVSE